MSTTPELELLRTRLREACDGQDGRLFMLLDAARIRGLNVFLRETGSEFVCLYRGDPEKELAHVAPYLTKCPLTSLLIPWLLVDTKAAESVLLLVADVSLEALRTHLRRWLIVLDSNGGENFFRFYDPRIVGPFWDASTPSERARFLGPIRSMLACANTPPVKEPLFRIWRAPEFLENPPNSFGKFVLRPEHEAAFAEDALERYESRCVIYLRGRHGEQLQRKSDDEVRQVVTKARLLGDHLGLRAGRDVTVLAEVVLLGGGQRDFDEIAATATNKSATIARLRDQLLKSGVSA